MSQPILTLLARMLSLAETVLELIVRNRGTGNGRPAAEKPTKPPTGKKP